MSKFKIGDKVMGYGTIYHDYNTPFYGKIKNIESDCGSIYYEIRGQYPIENYFTKDGCQIIWCWEKHLKLYDENKYNIVFTKYMEVIEYEKKKKQLMSEIEFIITE